MHAKAEIEARVWYSAKEKMGLIGTKEAETGKEKNNYGIKIHNFEINFPKGVPYFENYDTISESKKLKIFSNFYFPIEFVKTTYKELEKKPVTYTEDAAKQILIQKLEEELKKQILDEEKIVDTKVNVKREGNELEVELIYEVIENIGTNEKILL